MWISDYLSLVEPFGKLLPKRDFSSGTQMVALKNDQRSRSQLRFSKRIMSISEHGHRSRLVMSRYDMYRSGLSLLITRISKVSESVWYLQTKPPKKPCLPSALCCAFRAKDKTFPETAEFSSAKVSPVVTMVIHDDWMMTGGTRMTSETFICLSHVKYHVTMLMDVDGSSEDPMTRWNRWLGDSWNWAWNSHILS